LRAESIRFQPMAARSSGPGVSRVTCVPAARRMLTSRWAAPASILRTRRSAHSHGVGAHRAATPINGASTYAFFGGGRQHGSNRAAVPKRLPEHGPVNLGDAYSPRSTITPENSTQTGVGATACVSGEPKMKRHDRALDQQTADYQEESNHPRAAKQTTDYRVELNADIRFRRRL
jgi:hypothetical protein